MISNFVGPKRIARAQILSLAALGALWGAPSLAFAQHGDEPAHGIIATHLDSASTDEGPQVLRVEGPGQSAQSQNLVLAVNKTAFIDLPVDAHDVIVGNPGVAQAVMRTPRRAFLLGVGAGETSAVFLDAQGHKILELNLRIGRDVSSLRGLIEQFVPKSRVRVEPLGDNIIVAGRVPSASEADQVVSLARRFVDRPENVVNLLSIDGKEQVTLRVRIVELERTLLKQLGVNASALINQGATTFFNLSTANAFSIAGSQLGGLNTQILNNSSSGARDVTGIVQAFERAGVLRTLAEPNLTAISGESADFLAGGEFPVPIAQDDSGVITVQFKPFGIGLGFTPVVLSEGRISIRISTEVSELTNQGAFQTPSLPVTNAQGMVIGQIPGITIPALRVRRTQTTVEIPSGGSVMIAGLIRSDTRQAIEGIPGVKNLPVLGTLFRSRDFVNNETELAIIITPYLTDSINRSDVRTPADGFRAPGELGGSLLGRLNAIYRAPSADIGDRKFSGSFGFAQN